MFLFLSDKSASPDLGSGGVITLMFEKGTPGSRTFSKEKWTENELLMTVDHFGSGGRRSDSLLGRRGEKLGDCGIVGLWRNHDF